MSLFYNFPVLLSRCFVFGVCNFADLLFAVLYQLQKKGFQRPSQLYKKMDELHIVVSLGAAGEPGVRGEEGQNRVQPLHGQGEHVPPALTNASPPPNH